MSVVLCLGALGAILLSVGALSPVVRGGSPGFNSTPLLIVLALAPFGIAVGFAARGRHTMACATLAGLAALSPGRAVLDLQFLTNPSETARPELYLPTSLAEPPVDLGLWALMAGHLCIFGSGVIAIRRLREQTEQAGGAPFGGKRWMAATVLIGVVVAVGMLMAPFRSSDAHLVAVNAFEGTGLGLIGSLLLGCAVPLVGAVAMASAADDVSRGCLLGLAAGSAVIALPNLASGWSVQAAYSGGGPVVVLVGAAALVALAYAPANRSAQLDSTDRAGDANLPGQARMQVITGVLAIITGIVTIVGSFAPQVVTDGSVQAPESSGKWALFVAGLIMGVLGLALLYWPIAAGARPALSVAWVTVVLSGTATLDTAVAVTEFRGSLAPGSGLVWTVLAMCGSLIVACCCVPAGMLEREDDEGSGEAPSVEGRASSRILTPLVAAGILAIAGFCVPATVAPDYVASALFSEFGPQFWGLLLGLIVVLGALGIALRSRPARAMSLLLGAAVVVGLRAAEMPLASGGIPGVSVSTGTWLSLASAIALVIAAVMCVTGQRR